MIAKFLMCVLKKFHKPMRERIVLTSVSGLAFLIAFNFNNIQSDINDEF
jgi:hypothetical protein